MSVTFDYSGKLVLVTGSTAGIGLTIAEQYAKSGANVIVNSRKKESVDKTIKELSEKYVKSSDDKKEKEKEQKIYGFAADLSVADDCNKLVEYVKSIGHLDILVNNAGIFFTKKFEETTDKDWENIFQVNVMSTVRLCRAFLPIMLKNKERGGNIINISSEAGVRSLEFMIHYSMTKAAQLNISRGLAELTKGTDDKVRVNAVLPGPTMTPGVREFLKGFAKDKGYGDDFDAAEKAYFAEHEPNSIKGKFLDPVEIANGCLYLSSDAASAINGCAFKVEGGIVKLAF